MSPRFAPDQVGSYLRPPELIQARIAFQQGEPSREGLREVEDRVALTKPQSMCPSKTWRSALSAASPQFSRAT